MDSPSTRARRGPKPKFNTRDDLIRAGSKMVHRAGFASTGVKNIVDAAGVPKGSFYNHFESKEAFGKAVVDHYFAQGLDDLRGRSQTSKEEPLVRLRRFFGDNTRRFQTNGYLGGCMLGNMSLEIADHSATLGRYPQSAARGCHGRVHHEQLGRRPAAHAC